MDVYALLLQSIFPEQENYEVQLYFIYADEVFAAVYTQDRIRSLEKEFEHLIEEIKQYYPYTSKMIV